jgi:diguanylate cyclase (GGDEF)-like protein/putative nucleotidyltransferase with HDIG domain
MMKDKLKLPLESDIKQVLNFDIKEVPSLSPVISKLLVICSDEDASIEELSKLVETDPGISAKILGIASHALYSRRQEITTVSEAVIHLGFEKVKKLSIGVTVFEKMIKAGKQKLFDRIFFWRHCLCVASISMAIAKELQYPNPGKAYICGLLHDFGKIFFDLQGRANYNDFIVNVAKHTGPMVAEERKFMGMGHDDIGAYYGSKWNLPDSLVLTIKYHHQRYGHLGLAKEEVLLISIVSLANFLSWTQGMGSVDIIRPPILQPEIEENINLNKINYKAVISSMDRELKKTSAFYNFVFPSSDQFRENLLKANLKLCSINTSYYYIEDRQSKIIDISKIKDSITIPHRSLDPKEIITTTLQAIYQDFKFNRLYVMTVVKTLRSLKVVEFMDSTKAQMDLKSFEIPINKNSGGFVTCLRNKEPMIIKGTTSGEKSILKKFKIKEMLIVSFCSHNKGIGILGMDNIDSKKPILPDVFSSIAIVANELGMAMENALKHKEVKAASLKDGLTRLLNRVAIDELLTKSFRKAVEGKNNLSLVMIDVDFFKKFNDNFGHQAGDNILKLIATTLKKLTRPLDHVGRYGGEEFIVILNNTDLSKALVYAERIRKEIELLGKLIANRFPGLSLTVSAGVSEYQKSIKNKDNLIANADKALYRAKETGRNKVES